MNQVWWERDPKRLVYEIDRLGEIVKSYPSVSIGKPEFKESTLTLPGTVQVGAEKKEFNLIYPALFPIVCPAIKPKAKERWSSHQYGEGGTICLEIGPDNWDPQLHSGFDFIGSLVSLLDYETNVFNKENAPETPSRHVETQGQAIGNSFYRFVLPTAEINITPKSHGNCKISTAISSNTGIMWIKELPIGTAHTMPHGLQHGNAFNRDAKYFKFSIDLEPSIAKDALKIPELARLMIEKNISEEAAKEFDELAKDESAFAILFFEKGPPILVRVSKDDDQTRLKVIPATKIDGSVRVDPKQVAIFEDSKVAIVGLGSVGSKVAVSLSRIGVRDFILIDDEIIEFENIVRHEATMADISAHKVDMVADLIHLICPVEPTIKKEKIRIGGQANPTIYARILRDIVDADIIIDCTANGEVFQTLSAICSMNHKALIWCEVFAGGIGGIVGCATPDHSLTPIAVRKSLIDYLSNQIEAPNKDSKERYGDGALVADDNPVSIIANLVVYRTKQALLGAQNTNDTPTWIIGFERTWIFDYPFEIKKVPCRPEDYAKEVVWGKALSESVLTNEETEKYKVILNSKDNKIAD